MLAQNTTGEAFGHAMLSKDSVDTSPAASRTQKFCWRGPSSPEVASMRMSSSRVRSGIAQRNRWFSVYKDFSRLTWSPVRPSHSEPQRQYITLMDRVASATLRGQDIDLLQLSDNHFSRMLLRPMMTSSTWREATPKGGPLSRGQAKSMSIGAIIGAKNGFMFSHPPPSSSLFRRRRGEGSPV